MIVVPYKIRRGVVTLHSGVEIDLFHPNVDDFIIEDVAHHLSLICRWNGATYRFFSVAEHAVMTAERAKVSHQGYKRGLLMHDGEEHILGDNITPLKELFPELATIGDAIRNLLLTHFNIKMYDETIVKEYDYEQLLWERENIIRNDYYQGLPPEKAKQLFLQKYYEYLEEEKNYVKPNIVLV